MERKTVDDYDNLFDPELYLSTLYTDTHCQEDLLFLLRGFHGAFEKGNISGKRLLDIGTGPSICSVISATPHVDEIYLSDYSQANRDTLIKWREGTLSHNFSKMIDYFLSLEGKGETSQNREAELRKKVKGILACDLRKDKSLSTAELNSDPRPFDVITSSLCLEVAATDVTKYEQICKKIADWLKPGGFIILVGVLKQTFYKLGDDDFRSLSITSEEINGSWKSAGFEIVDWKEKEGPDPKDNIYSDCGGVFVMVAKKK